MNNSPVKAIVSGLGRIAWQYHLPAIIEHEQFELLAVADPLGERCREAEEHFKVAHAYESFEAMLEAETEADLLVLTSPTCFHFEQAIAAMKRGLDVFCEKPLASSLEEAEQIFAAMKQYGRKLMVYQPHRVRPETLALQEILASGLLGKIFMTRRVCGNYARRNDWQSQLRLGGGMLNNYGSHFIDQFMYVFGEAPYRLGNCELRRIVSRGDADDVAKITLISGNGIIGDLDINMASAYSEFAWVVYGDHGEARLQSDGWRVKYVREEDLPDLPLQKSLAAAGRKYASEDELPWQEVTFELPKADNGVFYDYLYDYLRLDRAPFVPVESTLELMRINAQCRSLAEKNCPLA